MALYNVHKRQTLDRLTFRYQLKMREVLRRDSELQVRDFRDALNAGARSITPKIHGLPDRVEDLFVSHRDKVIQVAVSDGIQEVTPGEKPELARWEAFAPSDWIEDTLTVQLASERDKITKAIKKKTAATTPVKVKGLTDDMLEAYLRNLKRAYRALAADWIEGESTVGDVVSALTVSLKRSDSSAKMIFQTETTNYFNESRQDYFSNNTVVDYMQLYAVTDGRISQICEDRHGAVVTISEASLKKYMPAFHPHCRTIQRPLISKLSAHKRIVEAGLALRAAHESSWAPTAWERAA